MATVIQKFDSIAALVKHCETKPVNMAVFANRANQNNLASQEAGSSAYKFRLTHNWNEAIQLATNGWDSGSKELLKGLNLANVKTQQKEVQRAINDIVGFQVNVPRYLQGVPQNMINTKKTPQKQKVITLVKSISFAAYFTTQQILDDSVKFLQLVQGIEKLGYRVNAYTIWNTHVTGERIIVRTKIKSASERLNISKISFPLMHPSFLRRLMFRCLEVQEGFKGGWSMGYGQPDQNCQPYLEKGEYYIPIQMSQTQIKELMSNLN